MQAQTAPMAPHTCFRFSTHSRRLLKIRSRCPSPTVKMLATRWMRRCCACACRHFDLSKCVDATLCGPLQVRVPHPRRESRPRSCVPHRCGPACRAPRVSQCRLVDTLRLRGAEEAHQTGVMSGHAALTHGLDSPTLASIATVRARVLGPGASCLRAVPGCVDHGTVRWPHALCRPLAPCPAAGDTAGKPQGRRRQVVRRRRPGSR